MNAAVLGSVLALVAVVPGCGGVSAAERAAVETYTTTVGPLAREGGRVVVQGIRPALSDLSSGRITGAEFRERAPGWKSSMERVRDGFAAAKPPAGLKKAASTFAESFDGYLRAIDAFVAASFKQGDALSAAISDAARIAETADKTYDLAVDLLKAERERVGLPETSEL